MKNLKKTGFITAAMFLMFLSACGGGSSSGSNPPGNGNNPPPVVVSINISPDSGTVAVGEQIAFTVTASNTDFTLSADAPAGCVISGSRVVCTPTAAGTYEIKATATADTTKTATARLTAEEAVAIEIAPLTADVPVGETTVFNVSISGTNDFKFTPPVGSGCVKISADAVECTPSEAGVYNITVTAMADETKTATAVLTATSSEAVTIEISPHDQSIKSGEASEPFIIAGQYTDFELSVDPKEGADCKKVEGAGKVEVVCTPTKEGVYNITATASDDPQISDAAVLTVFKDAEIDLPEVAASQTVFSGMNSNGEALVELYESNGKWKSYVCDVAVADSCEPIVLPEEFAAGDDDANIYTFGINVFGDILGYFDGGTEETKSYFLFVKGESKSYTLAGYEGNANTVYSGINIERHLVGEFTDAGGYLRGFMYDYNGDGPIMTLTADERVGCDSECETTLTGINNAGMMTGVYIDGNDYYHGFVYDRGSFDVIKHPTDNPINIHAAGINDSGYVAGYFYGDDHYARGFVKIGERFIVITHPDADGAGEGGTYVTGITDNGSVTGVYHAGGNSCGFILENIF